VFDFGRRQMDGQTPAINGTNTITVSCVRSPRAEGHSVEVHYFLKALPPEPNRSMRNNDGGFLRYFLYLDPARTRHWGDGGTYGTFMIEEYFDLDDRNRTATRAHVIYGTVDGNQPVQPGNQLGLIGARLEYRLMCR
jgi:spore coat protein U-like protein